MRKSSIRFFFESRGKLKGECPVCGKIISPVYRTTLFGNLPAIEDQIRGISTAADNHFKKFHPDEK